MSYISDAIVKHTCEISNFDTERSYISISHCGLSVDEIVEQCRKGFPDSVDTRLRCYKGYQTEADLKRRIKDTFPGEYSEAKEIQSFGGLVKGHPDFEFEGFPSDCKSVQIDEHLPVGRVPRKVFMQMQGYMLYGNKAKALVIYESRGSGKLMDFWVRADLKIQEEIHDKFMRVIKILNP